MKWYRRFTDRTTHPQLVRAGWEGQLLFDTLCDLSAREDLGGEIPPQHQDFEYLAVMSGLNRAGCLSKPAHQVLSEGFARAKAAGLIRVESLDGHGDIWILDGWERKQDRIPKRSAERVKRHRATVRAKGADVTPVTRAVTPDVTKSAEKATCNALHADVTALPPISTSQSLVSSIEGVQGETVPKPGWSFHVWAQIQREEAHGFIPEIQKSPEDDEAWLTEALGLAGNLRRLEAAYLAYLADPFWGEKRRRYPWAGFVKDQWRDKYLPPAESAPPPELACKACGGAVTGRGGGFCPPCFFAWQDSEEYQIARAGDGGVWETQFDAWVSGRKQVAA